MMIKFFSFFLALIQAFIFSVYKTNQIQTIAVNKYMTYQTMESFGTSCCWWAQNISDEKTAREIARYLFDDETGLGLDVIRYNVGAGEKDNPKTRICDPSRRTESFYVYDSEKGEYVYDFTRDANARRFLDYAIEYGADKVVLFCNSPHYSMTASGHASGGLTKYSSNLPKENYGAFVDYLLTIADWFVEQGYPVVAVAPINEPQWEWGGDWVGQEGCHYSSDETVEVLEMFAVEMQKRGCEYALSGPESGKLSPGYYDYIEKFWASPILNEYCEYFSGHSYWIDNQLDIKSQLGEKFAKQYPGKKLEMTEWCELPLRINSNSIDSALYMANIMQQDLALMNAVSWQSWTAVNGDGLMDLIDGELHFYYRYYTFMHFSRFIKPGMTRIDVMDSLGDKSQIASCAFKNDEQTVLILINNGREDTDIRLMGSYENEQVYRTDAKLKCELIYDGKCDSDMTLYAKTITTIVYTN